MSKGQEAGGGPLNKIGIALVFYQFIAIAVSLVIFWINAKTGTAVKRGGAGYSLQALIAYVIPMVTTLVLLAGPLQGHSVTHRPLQSVRHKKWLPVAMMTGIGISFLSSLILLLIQALLGLAHVQIRASELTAPSGAAAVILSAALYCIVAPVCEELLFRGLILQSLRRYGNRFAILLSSILFALLHGSIAQLPLTFLLGVALGVFALWCHSIVATIFIHAGVNALSYAVVLLGRDVGQMDAQRVFIAFGAGSLTVLVVALIVIRKKDSPLDLLHKNGMDVSIGKLLVRLFSFPALWAFMILSVLICIGGLSTQ